MIGNIHLFGSPVNGLIRRFNGDDEHRNDNHSLISSDTSLSIIGPRLSNFLSASRAFLYLWFPSCQIYRLGTLRVIHV
jgi:hypothetical protein